MSLCHATYYVKNAVTGAIYRVYFISSLYPQPWHSYLFLPPIKYHIGMGFPHLGQFFIFSPYNNHVILFWIFCTLTYPSSSALYKDMTMNVYQVDTLLHMEAYHIGNLLNVPIYHMSIQFYLSFFHHRYSKMITYA